ncbi:similar to Saccharomyces cerevisiae YMR073C IRC21 Putative protein of unknown function [Maudiozyma saulgeensis]|uniref:Cytochrome b5 heme-binding domain-containing protein n=1 Tax=Maudiozyma saulgeensis TaxID=1789683 RepID=A0A1X7R857_9SACH|nr:similar to Saccharomyces cerevisiae YMR073C IRC21 Putative protein of unknown function [Kazachstania saulgeensis]
MSQGNSDIQLPKINVSVEENIKEHEQDEQIKSRQTRFKIPTIQNSRNDAYRQQQQLQKDNQPIIIQQQPGCSTLGGSRGGGLARMGGGGRQKVRLAPGHSALDWSDLNKKLLQDKSRSNELLYGLRTMLEDENQVTILKRINSENMDTLLKLYRFNIPCHLLHPPLRINEQLLRLHQKDEHEFWTVIHGNVYCIGSYMKYHPGGSEILVHYGEKFVDVGFWFNKFHRWVNYEKLLQNCYIGKFVKDK